MAADKLAFRDIEELVRLKSNDELKQLIQRADPADLTDNCGTTLLHLAAKHNNADLAKHLLLLGHDSNAKNICGTTPLLMAASYNSSECLNALLDDENADVLSAPAAKGRSTLQVILDRKRGVPANIVADVLRHLRKKLVDADKTAVALVKTGCSLDTALLMKDAEVTERMLAQRKRCLGPSEWHRLLQSAMRSDYPENVRVLMAHGRGDYVSSVAFVNNLCNAIQLSTSGESANRAIIERMAEWNLYDHFWLIAALCRVFEQKSERVVRFLLDCNVDERVRDQYDFELLVHAFANGNFEASELLAHRDFDPNALSMNRSSGLCLAAAENLRENVRFLLKRGADPNLPDNYGMTPVHHTRDADCLMTLLKHGADLQVIGKQGQTVFDECNDCSYVKLAHLAMMEAQGVEVKPEIRERIDLDGETRHLYDKCDSQMDWLKSFNVGGKTTLFTVLTEGIDKFFHCVRSLQGFYMILERCRKSGMHDYYYLIMRRKVEKAAVMYDVRCKAAETLSEHMGLQCPGHLIINMIIGYLSLDELRILAGEE